MLWPMRSVFSPLLMLSADNSLKSTFAPLYVKVTTKGGQSQALLTRKAISGKLWRESKGQEDKSCLILCHYWLRKGEKL